MTNSDLELVEKIAWADEETKSKIEEDNVTNWRAIIVAGILTFLCGMESAFIQTSEWPYMKTIDEHSTYSFYGIALSISNWGNVVCSMAFAFWTYKWQTVRWPLLGGRVLAVIGSSLYVCVEVFPTNRRYVMLACYIIFAVAKSSTVVIRVYIVLVSSKADRTRAFSITTVAVLLSIVLGPLIQLAFSGIEYPGVQVLPHILFHLFSAPIWLATLVNVITIPCIFFGLPEMPKKASKPNENDGLTIKERLLKKWALIRSLDVRWILVLVLVIVRLAGGLGMDTIGGVITPIFMSTFGWDSVKTVQWISISMGIVGLLSIIVAAMFTIGPISKWIQSRTQVLIGLCIVILMYVISFPYPFLSTPAAVFNETAGSGCDPKEYNWCDSARSPYPYIFLPVVLLAMGIAVPTVKISLDTIYSKVVGDANQSIMQGFIVLEDDIISIVSPLYSSQMFSQFGMSIMWISNVAICAFGLILWIILYRKMNGY